jgi:DNA-binding HxlR family transcriptional regulator
MDEKDIDIREKEMREKEEKLKSLMSTAEERAKILDSLNVPEENEVFDITKDPYVYMMKLIFNRWKPFLLRAIAIDGQTYYSRFFKQLPISQKVLSQNLKEMVEDELIVRTVIPEVPPRVEYSLTEHGKSLITILDLIYDWGWMDMKRKGIPVDVLGEMWHGYRELDEQLMDNPFSTSKLKKK